MLRSAVMLVLAVALFLVVLTSAQEPTFHQRLVKNRYALTLSGSELGGSALPVLETAVHDAQFVLIGEDHGMA